MERDIIGQQQTTAENISICKKEIMMYIRQVKTKNKKTNTVYTKLVLVESYRTEKGPRQRTIMNLGAIDIERDKWKVLGYCLERKIRGQVTWNEEAPEIESLASQIMAQHELKERKLEDHRQRNEQLMQVDVNSLAVMETRSLGPEMVVNKVYRQLGFDTLLKKQGLNKRQRALAQIVITGRLIEPGSELNLYRWYQQRSALCELMSEDLTQAGKDGFYEITDALWLNKEAIEKSLYQTHKREFADKRSVFLYDLTNTYLEGQCHNNTLAKRGHSKEKRTDCPLVTLALVVDQDGFPVMSQIYKGNQSEPETLIQIMDRLESESIPILSSVKPTMIMDRGIATKANIELLVERGYPYTLIERRAAHTDYLKAYGDLESFETIGSDDEIVYVKKIEEQTTTKVLCLSYKRQQKEKAMDEKKRKRFVEKLEAIQRSVAKGHLKRTEKVSERIGRAKQQYPSIYRQYEIDVQLDTDEKNLTGFTWTIKQAQHEEKKMLCGCYVIESTHHKLDAKQIWHLYMTLNNVEAAFKSLKSQLGLRPVYHQNAHRTAAHLFIGVLAYHILITIEHQLRQKGDKRRWTTIKKELSTHSRNTIVLTNEQGKIYHVRLSGTPEPHHLDIYEKLEVPLFKKQSFSFVGSRS
jgi:transposase